MKKILFLFSLILSFSAVKAQEKTLFPQDFKLDPQILKGMVFSTIPEELHSVGITENPAVVDNKEAIRTMSMNNDDILQVYYEAYYYENSVHDDAGVVVSRFASEETLQNSLPQLESQSNFAYLIKDNYLIQVWSDSSGESNKQINDMITYYQNKLQAKLCNIDREKITEEEIDVITITEEIITITEDITGPSPTNW